jgi:Uma2 family endonuclease
MILSPKKIHFCNVKNKNMKNTKKKPEQQEAIPQKILKYQLHEPEPTIVEEPFIKCATLNLDESLCYSYADYLTWLDGKRRELINGVIHLFSAPSSIHARLTYLTGLFMGIFVRQNKGKCQIFQAPFDVRLPKNNELSDEKIFDVVQPDICVICDLSKLDIKGCVGAPDLIVEVLSPSTLKYDWNYKFNLYERAGVREYWIIDPTAKVINVFLLQDNGQYDLGTVYSCPQKVPVHIFEGLEIDLAELFE